MIAAWMIYGTAISLLLGVAGLALERALRIRGWPVRWVWVAALYGVLIVPFLPRKVSLPVSGVPAALSPAAEVATPVRVISAPLRVLPLAPPAGFSDYNTALLLAWTAASVTLLGILLAGMIRTRRKATQWRPESVDGMEVLVSDDVGPAVVGFVRSRILLPAWALAEGDEARSLVITHEREHQRARDPWMILSGKLLRVVLPWNLALWWLVARLRLAIETDCDARVVRAGGDPDAYSRLLLREGWRRSSLGWAAAPFSEPRSNLGRRVFALLHSWPRAWTPGALGLVALAVLPIWVACRVEQPTSAGLAPATLAVQFETDARIRQALARRMVRKLMERYYPHLLTTPVSGGHATVVFVANPRGQIENHLLYVAPFRQGVNTTDVILDSFPDLKKEDIAFSFHGIGASAPGDRRRDVVVSLVARKPRDGESTVRMDEFFFQEVIIESMRSEPQDWMPAAVAQHHPSVMFGGLERGKYVWFVSDKRGRILRTGVAKTDSAAPMGRMDEWYPGIQKGPFNLTAVRGSRGESIPIFWTALALAPDNMAF